ncbi:hypothetical protein [Georgenia sp. SUBG003]|uniref:hypothetical protein n=1 Tax=Georgenia sp. SUBG003 TaxID=1497974 RepID=UPI003AB4ABC9
MTELQARVTTVPGLAVTGAWVAGTGLASVVPHARAAAESLDRGRTQTPGKSGT